MGSGRPFLGRWSPLALRMAPDSITELGRPIPNHLPASLLFVSVLPQADSVHLHSDDAVEATTRELKEFQGFAVTVAEHV